MLFIHSLTHVSLDLFSPTKLVLTWCSVFTDRKWFSLSFPPMKEQFELGISLWKPLTFSVVRFAAYMWEEIENKVLDLGCQLCAHIRGKSLLGSSVSPHVFTCWGWAAHRRCPRELDAQEEMWRLKRRGPRTDPGVALYLRDSLHNKVSERSLKKKKELPGRPEGLSR